MSTMRTYDDGSHIDYSYSADGVKLRVDYYLNPYTPAVPDGEFGIACWCTRGASMPATGSMTTACSAVCSSTGGDSNRHFK